MGATWAGQAGRWGGPACVYHWHVYADQGEKGTWHHTGGADYSAGSVISWYLWPLHYRIGRVIQALTCPWPLSTSTLVWLPSSKDSSWSQNRQTRWQTVAKGTISLPTVPLARDIQWTLLMQCTNYGVTVASSQEMAQTVFKLYQHICICLMVGEWRQLRMELNRHLDVVAARGDEWRPATLVQHYIATGDAHQSSYRLTGLDW